MPKASKNYMRTPLLVEPASVKRINHFQGTLVAQGHKASKQDILRLCIRLGLDHLDEHCMTIQQVANLIKGD